MFASFTMVRQPFVAWLWELGSGERHAAHAGPLAAGMGNESVDVCGARREHHRGRGCRSFLTMQIFAAVYECCADSPERRSERLDSHRGNHAHLPRRHVAFARSCRFGRPPSEPHRWSMSTHSEKTTARGCARHTAAITRTSDKGRRTTIRQTAFGGIRTSRRCGRASTVRSSRRERRVASARHRLPPNGR